MKVEKIIGANLVDILNQEIYPAEVIVRENKIAQITRVNKSFETYILPGFIDAHIHIESSLLVPSSFAAMAVEHGTVATISDPHEIANVLGVVGVDYMIENGKEVPFHFFFGASPCVPATTFETAGNELDLSDLDYLLSKPEVKYLSEMMNWPGVIYNEPDILAKIALAQKHQKPIDGHAPGLTPEQIKLYVSAGISTDHECVHSVEAIQKMELGMKVQIREGSAARNFEALYPLIDAHFESMMFCSDDKHPDDFENGHINALVARAIRMGQNMFKVLQMACINPIKHYDLEVGMLQVGHNADFIEVDNLVDFKTKSVWIQGQKVVKEGKSLIKPVAISSVNKFNRTAITSTDIQITGTSSKVNVIDVMDGELITKMGTGNAILDSGVLSSNPSEDVLKIVVVNRYQNVPPAVGFIRNFKFKTGAIASSVAHDSHNIVAVGVNDQDIVSAINEVIAHKGGLSIAEGDFKECLPLEVAGLMSIQNGQEVAKAYQSLSRKAQKLGSTLRAPFMTLSFMALLVIPEIKMSDKGLFNAKAFQFMSVQV